MNVIPRPLSLSIRIILTLGLVYSMSMVTKRGVAEWYYRQPPPEGFRKAIEWDPGNPVYYSDLGQFLQTSLQGGELSEVINLYEKAVQLSPHRARYWAQLGGAYELAGRLDDARHAYELAHQLFPNSPDISWSLANFHIRQNRIADALRFLQTTFLGDAKLRRQTYDLVWRAGVPPDTILDKLIPADPAILFEYLDFLVGKKQLDAAEQTWSRILTLGRPFDLQASFPYLNALIEAGRLESLKQAWRVLGQRNSTLIRQRPAEANLLVNGDFESQILNGGLDWRISALEGVVVSVDTLTFFDGARSLRIDFLGHRNVEYHHVWQFIPVTPGTVYRFMGYMRTEAITTDSGPRFQLLDAYDPSRLALASEPVLGSSRWAPAQLEFRTGPETRLLLIRIYRPSSFKLDNLIKGTVWIDRVSLIPVP